MVFTASLQGYANPLLDLLDPARYVAHRLFRQHCTSSNIGYIKDLSRINRNIKDMIIIDNSPVSYHYQPENAIAISSWFDSKID